MAQKEVTIGRPSRSSALSFHKESRSLISKPTIRIIHIFAPEVIMTDTANFRDLVQKLTGKQADRARSQPSTLKSHQRKNNKLATMGEIGQTNTRKAEHFDVFREGLELRERPLVKDEQGGYLKDFADLDDGFMLDAPIPHALL